MITAPETQTAQLQARTIAMLHELSLGVHRLGYKYLTVAVPRYYLDDSQSLSKELYPYVAEVFGCTDWHSVERSIRAVILDARKAGNEAVWAQYFPGSRKPPSNKAFLAVLAERLR